MDEEQWLSVTCVGCGKEQFKRVSVPFPKPTAGLNSKFGLSVFLPFKPAGVDVTPGATHWALVLLFWGLAGGWGWWGPGRGWRLPTGGHRAKPASIPLRGRKMLHSVPVLVFKYCQCFLSPLAFPRCPSKWIWLSPMVPHGERWPGLDRPWTAMGTGRWQSRVSSEQSSPP